MSKKIILTRLILIASGYFTSNAYADTYIGSAFGAEALSSKYSNTGLLPTSGGNLSASLASLNVTSGITTILTTSVISSTTIGASQAVTSISNVSTLRLYPGTGITPDLVSADALVTQVFADSGGVLPSSTITNLKVLGVSVSVTGAPNQIYSVLNVVDIVINKQVLNGDGSMTLDALSINVTDPARIGQFTIAESRGGFISSAATPEPSTLMLLTIAPLVLIARRKRNA
jgi:hypothetical protein